MAIISSNFMNLVEAQKRDGFTNEADFFSQFVEENDFLNVLPWEAANHGTYDKYLQVKKLPKGSWSKVNSGISTDNVVTDSVTLEVKDYDGMSEIDERIFKGVRDKTALRNTEDMAWFKGLTEDWLHQVLYNEDTDLGFAGLFTRRNKISEKDFTCWNAGGASSKDGALTSILMAELGPQGLSMLYREGEKAGLSSEDRGRHLTTAPDGKGGKVYAWTRYFNISGNIKIKNERAVQRLANIDITSAFPMDKIVNMKYKLPNKGRNACIFANSSVQACIANYCISKNNINFSMKEIEGLGEIPMILNIPVLNLDAIKDDEAHIA